MVKILCILIIMNTSTNVYAILYINTIVFNGCRQDRSGCGCVHHVSGRPVHLHQQVRMYVICLH